ELGLAYIGSAHRLARHLADILADKEAIVTTIVHGATARGSFADVVFNRTSRFESCPLQRIRVSLKMPEEVYRIGGDKRWFVGLGAADPADIPQLTKELKHADSFVRRDAADLLGLLGLSAKEAVPELYLMLKDESPAVVAHAAAAILRIVGKDDQAARTLLALAEDKKKAVRPLAIRLLAGARPSSDAMLQAIRRQLDDPFEEVQRAAIDALGRLGPEAETAAGDPVKILPRQA